MTERKFTVEKFNRIFPLILSVLTVTVGVCYIVAVCHLYFTGGDTPYSRERAGEYLLWLLAPSSLLIIGCVYGFAISRGVSVDKKQLPIDNSMPLAIMTSRVPLSSLSADVRCAILSERKRRLIVTAVAGALALLFSVIAIIVATDGSNYSLDKLNASIISVCTVALPLAVSALGVFCVATILCRRSENRELELLRHAARETAKVSAGDAADKPSILNVLREHREVVILGVRIAVIALSVTFIILGVFNGGMKDVLGKAVKICTECIGLG